MKHSKLEKYFNQKAEVQIVDDTGKVFCLGHFPDHDRLFEMAEYDLTDNAPTANVSPVKHVHWISTKYKCSECGVIVWGNDFNFCPNCGATMLKEGET